MTDLKQGEGNGIDIVLEKSTGGVKPNPVPQDQIASIPRIFCADKVTAKALLTDIFALTGALHGIEEGQVDPKTIKVVLSNEQRMISTFGDILIRDCNLTETDINDVMKVFETNAQQPSPKKEQNYGKK